MTRYILRLFALIALVFASSFASAQFTVTDGGAEAASVAPSYLMPAGKIFVNDLTMRHRGIHYTDTRVKISCTGPAGCGDLVPAPQADGLGGAFRISCFFSHVGYDDPIVWPGRPGMSHLHIFFGNTTTSGLSDAANMSSRGESTCTGGILNRTGYWVPAAIYHCPAGELGCDRARDGEIQYSTGNQVYYKSENAYSTNPSMTVGLTWPTDGLRMIAGDPNSHAVMDGNVIRIACGNFFDHIPTTAEANAAGGSPICGQNGGTAGMDMLVYFPQCENTGGLTDSPDHKSHLRYKDNTGCTVPGFTKLIPDISYNVHYVFENNADLDFIRLSSDVPKAEAKLHGVGSADPWPCATAAKNWCAGASLHGDWANGWSFAPFSVPGVSGTFLITDLILNKCLRGATTGANAGLGQDCHVNLLGNIDSAHPNDYYWMY